MEEILYRPPTSVTPEIKFDPENQSFGIKGISRPEDAYEFYEAILVWTEAYVEEVMKRRRENKLSSKTFTLMFDFRYMNSASSKYIFQIISSFRKIHEQKLKLRITWFYESADDQILEDGEDFSEITGVPFEFVSRKK